MNTNFSFSDFVKLIIGIELDPNWDLRTETDLIQNDRTAKPIKIYMSMNNDQEIVLKKTMFHLSFVTAHLLCLSPPPPLPLYSPPLPPPDISAHYSCLFQLQTPNPQTLPQNLLPTQTYLFRPKVSGF